jgi:hypothetical protein
MVIVVAFDTFQDKVTEEPVKVYESAINWFIVGEPGGGGGGVGVGDELPGRTVIRVLAPVVPEALLAVRV